MPDLHDLHEPAIKKRRVWLWLLLLLGTPLVLYLVWVVTANRSLDSLLVETDRLDPGWRWEELEAKRATHPPERNAANRIIKIKQMIPQELHTVRDAETTLQNLQANVQLNLEQIAALTKLLNAAGPARAEARTMIDFPLGRHATGWDSTFLASWPTQHNRAAVHVLQLDAMDLAQRGDIDGAIRSAQAAFQCGSSIGDDPLMMAQLVRMACQAVGIRSLERALAQGEPSEELLATLQQRIEESEREPILLFAFRGERAWQYQMLLAMRDGTYQNPAAGPGGFDWQSIMLRIPGVVATQTAAGIQHLNELVEVAKQPPETWTAQFASQATKANSLPVLARMLASSLARYGEAVQRGHAIQRAVIAAIAAERFRKKNSRWPSSLDELKSAGLLKEIPTDPFVGGNLKMKRTDDGLIFYSVGKDLTDNGGKVDWDRPAVSGLDVGFQLWDVAKRRQPAPRAKPAEEPTPP